MLWRGIDFGWDKAAWLLPLAFLIIFAYIFLDRYRRKKLEALGDTTMRAAFVAERIPVLFWSKVVLLSLTWVCGVVALMQPQGSPQLPGVESGTQRGKTGAIEIHRRHDIAFLVDVSASMGAIDNGQGNAQRLGVAKEVVDSVISGLGGENVSLAAFTSQPLPIVPLTTDYLFTRLMLRGLDLNEGETAGTNILRGLEEILPSFEATPMTVAKTLVVLSDGGDTDIDGEAGKQHIEAITSAIEKFKGKGVRVITVGVGSLKGATVPSVTYEGKPVESAQQVHLLQGIASPNGYYDADGQSSLSIAQQIGKDIDGRTVVLQEKTEVLKSDATLDYHLYYQYPLAVALGALALFFLLPDTFRRRKEAV